MALRKKTSSERSVPSRQQSRWLFLAFRLLASVFSGSPFDPAAFSAPQASPKEREPTVSLDPDACGRVIRKGEGSAVQTQSSGSEQLSSVSLRSLELLTQGLPVPSSALCPSPWALYPLHPAILRNFAPVAPFVVGWQWPIFRRRGELDPTHLKSAAGRPTKHSSEALLKGLADQRLTTGEWRHIARTKSGIPKSTFFELLSDLETAGEVQKSVIDGKWERICKQSGNSNHDQHQ